MMKKKIYQALAGLAMAVGALGSAHAGATFAAGGLVFTIENFDVGTTNYGTTAASPKCASVAACDAVSGAPPASSFGADSWGIFTVDTISQNAVTIWTKGGANGYLTGIFGGLQDNLVYVTPNGPPGSFSYSTFSTGGFMKLWANATDYNPSLGPNAVGHTAADLYTGISGGALMLSANFGTGADAFVPWATYAETYHNGQISGSGDGYLDITGGAWGCSAGVNCLNTDGFIGGDGNTHDLYLTNSFDDANAVASSKGWTVTSSGQVKGNDVPEPGSLALLGLGLAGLAAMRRRST